MDYRFLGASGFKVPVLTFGHGHLWRPGRTVQGLGSTDVAEAKRLVDLCLEAGLNMSTPPTSIRTARPRRFWARPSRAVVTQVLIPPRPPSVVVPAPTRSAPRAIISFDPSIAPCALGDHRSVSAHG